MSFLKRLMARKADIAAEARLEDEDVLHYADDLDGDAYEAEDDGYDGYEDGDDDYYEDDEYEAYEEEDIEDDLAEFPDEAVEAEADVPEPRPAAAAGAARARAPAAAAPVAAAPAAAPAATGAAPGERMDTRAIVRQIATTEMRSLLSRVAEQSPKAGPAALEPVAGKAAKIWDLDAEDEAEDADPHRVTTEATLRAVAAAAATPVSPPEPMPPARTLSAMVRPRAEAEANPVPTMPDPVIPSPEIPTPQHFARNLDAPHLLKQPGVAAAPAPQAAAPEPQPAAPAPQAAPAGRQKTRLLGFQSAPVAADVFDAPRATPAAAEIRFPTGWIVVVDGPGRGACFTLGDGVTQIGRGEDQGIRLDFGDTSISRNNHAAVAFDGETGSFFLGHGGKTNLVRLNGRPVLATEDLQSMDEIRIGETTLRFVAFCGEGFSWAEGADLGKDAASA